MKCPFCNASDTKVIDSRPADDNSSIRRRRQCEQCGRRFTTYEKLETMPLMVIKKDDSRETYDRSKLEKGILLSCHKRPVSSQEISTMIDGIENQIFNMGEREIPASLIGELVMKKLKDVDELFRRVTGMDVRIASAETGVAEESKEKVADPAYATAVGILLKGAEQGACRPA